MLRVTRFIAFFTTIFAPGIYVAITTFHAELIPTDLLFTMAAAAGRNSFSRNRGGPDYDCNL